MALSPVVSRQMRTGHWGAPQTGGGL